MATLQPLQPLSAGTTISNVDYPKSTYEQSKITKDENNNMVGIESYSMQVDAWSSGAKISMDVRVSNVPTSIENLVQILADDYLKSQGLPDTLEEMIAKFYPEYKI